jgi:hypothetical protein
MQVFAAQDFAPYPHPYLGAQLNENKDLEIWWLKIVGYTHGPKTTTADAVKRLPRVLIAES